MNHQAQQLLSQLPERSLNRVIEMQAEKIERQAKELANLNSINIRDARQTKAIVAFKFFLKCLTTR
jgi:gamma-glutamyl phosphate reductase